MAATGNCVLLVPLASVDQSDFYNNRHKILLVFYLSYTVHCREKSSTWRTRVFQSWTAIHSLQHIMMVCVLIASWLCARWQWTNGERCHFILWGLYPLSNINIRVLSYITRYYLTSGYNTSEHMTALATNHVVYQLLSFGGPHNTKSAFSIFESKVHLFPPWHSCTIFLCCLDNAAVTNIYISVVCLW